MNRFTMFVFSALIAAVIASSSMSSAAYRRVPSIACVETDSFGNARDYSNPTVWSAGKMQTSSSYPEAWCPIEQDSAVPIGSICTINGGFGGGGGTHTCVNNAWVNLYNESGATAQCCLAYYNAGGGTCGTATSPAGSGYAGIQPAYDVWNNDTGPYDAAYFFINSLGSGSITQVGIGTVN